ncbi:MAG: 50S ribosomal protein L25/general stress protein Ctc [Candidatus Omnitrophica bacterium]|nr:50S ribosomal protein L25/general stress protein Ctc [Candidatus Omnitrophota bacterium]
MEIFDLKVRKRSGATGSQVAKKLRKQGIIPGVVYSHGEEAVALEVPKKELSQLLNAHADENLIVNLDIDGTASRTALVSEVQTHPVNEEILHIDFKGISMDETVVVNVAVHAKGESVGVKEGGVIDHVHREIEIECLPSQIPERIEVDITNLAIGDSIHVSNLVLPEGVVCLDDPEAVIMTVLVPRAEEEVAPAEPAVEGEEAVVEPEVIKKGKEQPEEEAPEE